MTNSLENLLAELHISSGAAAAVGTFDGVHLGHRKLLEKTHELAKEQSISGLAIIFRSQPRAFLQPAKPVTYLASLEKRVQLIKKTGIDHVALVDFDERVRARSAYEFLDLLKKQVGLRTLVLGPGARLGHDRVGAADLNRLASDLEIQIVEVQPAQAPAGQVSSSAIRKSLSAGDVGIAETMLGRPYALEGTVEHGDERGRELGFPTANIGQISNLAVPADGIYATIASVNGERWIAATSIGVRPTFGGGVRLIEAYLLDFSGDLYDQKIELEFIKRLRGEVKFDGVESLVEQMNKDVEETKAVLSDAI